MSGVIMPGEKNKLSSLLEKNTAIFFLLAIVFRNVSNFFYPPDGTDHVMLHTAVSNLIQGHGLSFPIANLQDLSIVRFQPMNEWPPFVGYLIYAVKVFVADTRATDMILITVGTLLLLFALKKIMKSIEIRPMFQSITWIIIATNPEPLYRAGISDTYSGLCMLWGVVLSIEFVQNRAIKIHQLFVASFVFFLPAAFRYQYYPLIFICPLFLVVAGRLLHQKELLKRGQFSFLIVALLLIAQIAVLYFQTGAAARIADDKLGIYFENLLSSYPFLVKSFLNTSYFENILVANGGPALVILNIIYFLVTVSLLYKISGYIITHYKSEATSAINKKKKLYVSWGFILFVSLSIVLFLYLLSLIYSPQLGLNGMFTYAKEGRYFLVPVFLLLLVSISILQDHFISVQTNTAIFYKAALVIVLFINSSLFAKFCYNIVSGKQKIHGTSWVLERENVFKEIEKQKQKFKIPVVVTGTAYFSYQPIKESFGIVKKLKYLNEAGINSTKPIQLLIITQPSPDADEEKFINEKKAALIFVGKKCRMYQLLKSG